MPLRRQRVLVLRTSRFAGIAVAYARRRWPEAEVRMLYQRGAEADVRAAGLEPTPSDAVPAGARITPLTLLREPAGRRAVVWRPDAVVLQWWNPHGRGHEAADRAALVLRRGGFHAVFEDGTGVTVPASTRILKPLLPLWRVIRGTLLVMAIGVGTIAAWPVIAWSDWRRRARTA